VENLVKCWSFINKIEKKGKGKKKGERKRKGEKVQKVVYIGLTFILQMDSFFKSAVQTKMQRKKGPE
jgi:hypothetical protein